MPTQELNGDYYSLYRHKRDHRVEYWGAIVAAPDTQPHEANSAAEWGKFRPGTLMHIRATQNALHPEWDEVPLEFTVDGGTMDYEAFTELYERVEDGPG